MKSQKEVAEQQEQRFFFLLLLDDRRIQIRTSEKWSQIRIQEGQIHMNPTDPNLGTQHWLKAKLF
jgi:hypothetical protein